MLPGARPDLHPSAAPPLSSFMENRNRYHADVFSRQLPMNDIVSSKHQMSRDASLGHRRPELEVKFIFERPHAGIGNT